MDEWKVDLERINNSMNEWLNEWMNNWMNWWVDGLTERVNKVNERLTEWMHDWMNRRIANHILLCIDINLSLTIYRLLYALFFELHYEEYESIQLRIVL